jgi:hypothetical protein
MDKSKNAPITAIASFIGISLRIIYIVSTLMDSYLVGLFRGLAIRGIVHNAP